MSTRKIRSVSLGALASLALGMSLAGCGSDHKQAVVVTPPAVAPTKLEDTFGTGFGADYRASANSEPVHPAAGDLNAVSLTTEPTALH